MAGETILTKDPLVIARFWSKVEVGRPGTCWPWHEKSRHEFGYGVFRPRKDQRTWKAHRFAWEVVNGEIPEGLVVMHKCDNPPCCNPAHLQLGSQAENTADMISKGRQCRGEQRSKKLTESDVIEIREMVARGMTHEATALAYDVSPASISLIATGSHWKHVGGPITRLADRTHCRRRNHEMNEANTYTDKFGRRRCRACIRISQEKYLQHRKAS